MISHIVAPPCVKLHVEIFPAVKLFGTLVQILSGPESGLT